MEKEMLDKALNARAVMRSRNAPISGVCYYDLMTSDGKQYHVANTICHAGMQSPSFYIEGKYRTRTKSDIPITAIINRVMYKEPIVEDEAVAFYNWMANTSPWASCFVTKDGVDIVENDAAILCTDVPTNLLMGALIATRALTEHMAVATTWYDLQKLGVNPSVAFFFAHEFNGTRDQHLFNNIISHSCLGYGSSFDNDVNNFIVGDGKFDKPYVEKNAYAYNTNNMWSKPFKGAIKTTKQCTEALNKIGKTGEKISPFKKSTVYSDDDDYIPPKWPYDEAINIVATILKENYK